MAKAGRGSDAFVVRLPDGMRDRIRTAAETNNRSMNAEVVARLEASFPDEPEGLNFSPEGVPIDDFPDALEKAHEAYRLALKRIGITIGKARKDKE